MDDDDIILRSDLLVDIVAPPTTGGLPTKYQKVLYDEIPLEFTVEAPLGALSVLTERLDFEITGGPTRSSLPEFYLPSFDQSVSDVKGGETHNMRYDILRRSFETVYRKAWREHIMMRDAGINEELSRYCLSDGMYHAISVSVPCAAIMSRTVHVNATSRYSWELNNMLGQMKNFVRGYYPIVTDLVETSTEGTPNAA